MANKTVVLKNPIVWFEKQLTSIELKEPTGLDFINIGEPQTFVRSRDQSVYAIQNDGVIKSYLEKLLAVDGGLTVLAMLSLADTMALKNGLLDFFADAAQEIST